MGNTNLLAFFHLSSFTEVLTREKVAALLHTVLCFSGEHPRTSVAVAVLHLHSGVAAVQVWLASCSGEPTNPAEKRNKSHCVSRREARHNVKVSLSC